MNYNQNRGYMPNPPMQHNNGWNNQNRNNLDMPNLQALGINPQGQNPSNQGQNMSNPLGKCENPCRYRFIKAFLLNIPRSRIEQQRFPRESKSIRRCLNTGSSIRQSPESKSGSGAW